MKRRDFSMGAAALAALGVPGLAAAQAKAPEDGVEYITLGKRVAVEAPQGKVDVIEFFWYSCSHCNAFEPMLQAWVKQLPADVSLRRIPVAFRDDMEPQQRLFYALDAMGKVDELHGKVFQAIHKERLNLSREEGILEWIAKQGLDAQKFQELYRSFAVSTKARRATEFQNRYQVQGVPALGIAGRWYTDGSLTGNMQRALQVTEHLIAQARQA
jgi:protein dithiol oxidoreductase (disulfide-forming)